MGLRIGRRTPPASSTPTAPSLASAVRRRPCGHHGCPQIIQAPAAQLDEMVDLHDRLVHSGASRNGNGPTRKDRTP